MIHILPDSVGDYLNQVPPKLILPNGPIISEPRRDDRWVDEFEFDADDIASLTAPDFFSRFFIPLDAADQLRLMVDYRPNTPPTFACNNRQDVAEYFGLFIRSPVEVDAFEDPVQEPGGRDPPHDPAPAAINLSTAVELSVDGAPSSGPRPLLALVSHRDPGAIRADEWRRTMKPSAATLRLGQELVGYMHHYRCPTILAFDGIHAVILLFGAYDQAEDFRRRRSRPYLYVHVLRADQGGVGDAETLGFAFYLLVKQGYEWAMAERMQDHGSRWPDGRELRREWITGRLFVRHRGRDRPAEEAWCKRLDVQRGFWVWLPKRDNRGAVYTEHGATSPARARIVHPGR